MKKKLSTRIFSIFLAVLMAVSIIPAGAITAQAANYIYPVLGYNYVSSSYGSRWGTYHYGIDIATGGNNNVVVATQSGVVKRVSNNCWHVSCGYKCEHYNSYGNLVVIQHDDGSASYYGHLKQNSIKVSVGQRVQAGQEIAQVGSSGYSTGVHLHFEIRTYYGANRSTKTCKNVNPSVMGYQYISSPTNAVPPKPAIPDKPTITGISATDIAIGKSVTITWNESPRATSYNIAIRGADTRDIAVGGSSRSCTFTLNKLGVHSIYVEAKNESGTSPNNNYKTCTTHNPVTVTFVDYDDTLLKTQTVDYGSSATAPVSPERKGYTFQGWSDSFYNVTADKTVKATYKINTYTVNFYDRNGNLLKSEKVDYGNDATPPTNTNNPTGYEFHGWDSENYKNVYTDAANKTININGIYAWFNDDLPVVCNITSASRQPDGYYVYFDLTNYDKAITRGRAVVSLKTTSGKLVDMTESAAFSIPVDSTKKGMEVFIPCDFAATSVEVIIVDSYSSGVPISEVVSSSIDQGLMWSEWSETKPDAGNTDLEIESRIEYRYRDKETSTGNTKTKDGWIYDGTYSAQVGNWSGWQDSVISAYSNESVRREVSTQSVTTYSSYPQYNYYRYAANYSGGYSSEGWQYDKQNAYFYTFDSELGYGGTSSRGTPWYKWYYNGSNYCAVYRCGTGYNTGGTFITYKQVATGTKTQYRYRDTNYTYNFYRWKDWSDWTTDEVTATSNREVDTRTTYRYKSVSAGTEDDSGKEYTISNKVSAEFAGKQITLYVYGYTGASDYTNEYIGQSVVGEDGSYSFTFKLREEPTAKTGDFTVAIGLEGTTNLTVIDTIEAPKPTYKVNFYDWDGTVISSQTVNDGEDAVLPENPEKEGYDFIGWDKSVANIKEDTDFFADFKKKEYTVVFIDWQNQLVEVQTFEHGDILTPPEYEEIEGYTFEGWDQILNGNSTVTQDMVVTALYEINTYTVKFYDFDNNVISTQTLEYGETAQAPESVEESSDGKQFAGWFNPEEYQNVDHDAAIYPTYYFEETTPNPSANLSTGEYDDEIQLELSCEDENAVIFYYVDGDESTEAIYTEPVTIDKTSSVTFYATSLGKNDSEKQTNYYCINSSDKPSDWMLYSDLPQDVTENQDDYILESETGYRFKDITSTSDKLKIDELIGNGWTLENTTFTDYTEWQDEPIDVDNSLLGFEVDTRETDDNTVTRYQYSHYSYVDGEGVTQFSPKEVDGYDCKYEEIILDSRLTIAGFLEDNTSYYNHDGQRWFTQVRVPGVKTQYRLRYQVAEYYKWTSWGIDAPAIDESREYETDTVYRYANKNYHIVTVWDGFGDLPIMTFVQDKKEYDSSVLDVYGFNLEGLYYDETYTEKFDLSSPVTESVTLYAKYTPKTYTVTFQMQDGTELDVQEVEYLSDATPPATDVVPGYVFGGWDKDFSCITEDTVITGTYFKESEYARISLDRSKAQLYQGSSLTLIPTIMPSNLSDEPVEWSSSDPGIASVDDTGRVTAVSAGTATITVKVLKTRETATCEVTVDPDKNNFIILKSDSSLNYDELGYLRRIDLNTTVDEIKDQFTNNNLYFYDINGNELDDEDIIGTGTQIKLFNGDEVVDTKTVVITGDMTGDGLINNRDVAMMNKTLIGTVEADEYQMLAIDVNGDGSVNNRDAAMVARYLVGKDTF